MGFFKKVISHWTKSKNPESPRYRHDMAEKICGYPIKYITQRNPVNDNEDVIGRSGSLNIKRETDELIVSTPSETILRCDINDLQAWILMSGDGVVITGPNIEQDGKERSLIAYFVYYRK